MPIPTPLPLINPDHLRSQFIASLSKMYRTEVPMYQDLVECVNEINERVGGTDSTRLAVERHGAIRLGTPSELSTTRRLFGLMNMHPVNYYDLSTSAIPVHSTAFRPIDASLEYNPFRVFCSLLRPDLIVNDEIRDIALDLLSKRQIFPPALVALIEKSELAGGVSESDAAEFVDLARGIFEWKSEALVEKEVYEKLKSAHSLVADIAAFKGPHINHLTPRTLDIDAVQVGMWKKGLESKNAIEGPPLRACPILLRQTSFQAVQEPITFVNTTTGERVQGYHRARFGEVEARGVALTPKGLKLYHECMAAAFTLDRSLSQNDVRQNCLHDYFLRFPDTWAELRKQGLAYFQYTRVREGKGDLETLISSGAVVAEPITYEDFLPASAAGIFTSNLGMQALEIAEGGPDREGFEKALGRGIVDADGLYKEQERKSLGALGL